MHGEVGLLGLQTHSSLSKWLLSLVDFDLEAGSEVSVME